MICALPPGLTAIGVEHVDWHSCAIAPVIGAGGVAGFIHVRPIAFDELDAGVAVNAAGAAGPWLSTTTGGNVAVWVLPAGSVTTIANVCGPSGTCVVSTLSDPAGSCGHGG